MGFHRHVPVGGIGFKVQMDAICLVRAADDVFVIIPLPDSCRVVIPMLIRCTPRIYMNE